MKPFKTLTHCPVCKEAGQKKDLYRTSVISEDSKAVTSIKFFICPACGNLFVKGV